MASALSGIQRLRWRRRGAWMWPLFVVLTLVDGLILHHLPFTGDGSPYIAGALIAGFANLVLVAVVAPLIGLWLRRRDPSLPWRVAWDHAGVGALLALTLILVGTGFAHRPAVLAEEREFDLQAAVARQVLLHRAPPPYRRNLARADTWALGPELYRTCAPRDDGERAFCVLVDTSTDPPAARVDPNRTPGSSGSSRPGVDRGSGRGARAQRRGRLTSVSARARTVVTWPSRPVALSVSVYRPGLAVRLPVRPFQVMVFLPARALPLTRATSLRPRRTSRRTVAGPLAT
jgi:hypothetical protein